MHSTVVCARYYIPLGCFESNVEEINQRALVRSNKSVVVCTALYVLKSSPRCANAKGKSTQCGCVKGKYI